MNLIKTSLAALAAFFCITADIQANPRQSLKIVATVNDEIISTADFQNQLKLFLLTTKIPFNEQTQNMILERVLNSAIDEKIKLQTAEKNDIKVTDKEVNSSIGIFEKNNKIPAGEMKSILRKAGISYETFRNQAKADLAWSRLVRRQMMGNNLTQTEINKAMEDAKKDLTTPKYFISEIFIKKEHAKNIQDLVSNLRQDPRFELYAMQFSESPTASNGGKLGWVNYGKLNVPIEKALNSLKEGEISDPIAYADGYFIFKLDKVFDPKKDKPQMPTREEIIAYLQNQRMEETSQQYLADLRTQAVIEIRN